MISGLPVTEERDAKRCFARKGGTARHSPFAHLCEGRFLRVGNEQCNRVFEKSFRNLAERIFQIRAKGFSDTGRGKLASRNPCMKRLIGRSPRPRFAVGEIEGAHGVPVAYDTTRRKS